MSGLGWAAGWAAGRAAGWAGLRPAQGPACAIRAALSGCRSHRPPLLAAALGPVRLFRGSEKMSMRGAGGFAELPERLILVCLSEQSVCAAAHEAFLHNTPLMP